MAMYFGSGEGRCPSSSTSVKHTFKRAELEEMARLYVGHDIITSALEDYLLGLCVGPLAKAIKAKEFFVDLGLSVLSDVVGNFMAAKAEDIIKLLVENSKKTSYTLTLKLRCVNKGQNGHYWTIYSWE